MKKAGWILVGVVALALVAGGFVMFHQAADPSLDRPVETVEDATLQPSPSPRIRYPVAEPQPDPDAAPSSASSDDQPEVAARPRPSPTPLPALEKSDAPLLKAAEPVLGSRGLPDFLVPQALIEHIVVTIDNLDKRPIRLDYRPLKHVPGQPVVSTQGGDTPVHTLTAANAERYAPYVEFLEALDPARVALLYRRFYPLFQQAYRNLGYPQAYFNDRLVAIIDHLLATPEVNFPILLVQPKVFYQFADPALEKRSWGQKTLIRMGPQNRAKVQRFLRALREGVTAVDQGS